jgi:hypothetical protein
MSDAPKSIPKSVALAAEKARIQRVQRLKAMLEQRLENPILAVDALMAEAAHGESQGALWEQLHASAARDHVEPALADAYTKCIDGQRMRRLSPNAQADVLMHAADYFQGVLGDPAKAEGYLERVLVIVPGHPDAFGRLERRLEKLLDSRRLVELYATVAAAPPKAINVLATQAWTRVLQVKPTDPISDDACKKLVALVPTNAKLLEAIESHCRATKRFALACEVIELALVDAKADAPTPDWRSRAVDLYMGDAGAPAMAMPHVEVLLQHDPSDAHALKVGEKLLSNRDVASRAAAALQMARRSRGGV